MTGAESDKIDRAAREVLGILRRLWRSKQKESERNLALEKAIQLLEEAILGKKG